MNQPHSYMDVHQGHMSNPSASSTSSGPTHSHYASYPQHQSMQNGVPSYGSSPVAYSPYGGYTNGMGPMHSAPPPSSMSSQMVQQSPMSLPTLATNTSTGSAGNPSSSAFDTTGQVAPPGMKPRVTATLWEDEGTLCFQVEAESVCVARREDNHFINGTKLLNVAGMTRGRRDGILKSEKTRHVVKIGPMHLKGVWIPFERALDFANKEKITERLYPLFVHNIGALLYHPQNNARQSFSGQTMAAAERRRPDGQPELMRTPQSSQPPSLQHHHSLANPTSAHAQQPPHAIAPHPASGRPGIERAQTFPTPPTSAGGMIMGNPGSSYEWGGAPVSSVQTSQPLSIDTSISTARSVPTTPASTPPGNSMQSVPHYQTSGPYDHSRMYSTSSTSSQYGNQFMNRYGQLQPSPSLKSEMAPPARIGHESEHGMEPKQYSTHAQDHAPSSDAENDHDGEYTHSAGPYGHGRSAYGYGSNNSAPVHHDRSSHVSPDMTGSPQKGPGRSTPRTTANYAGYNAPNRSQQLPSSNLYGVIGDNRAPTNSSEMYSPAYPSHSFTPSNGLSSNKRGLDMDDQDDHHGLKRQKTVHEDGRPRPMISQKKR